MKLGIQATAPPTLVMLIVLVAAASPGAMANSHRQTATQPPNRSLAEHIEEVIGRDQTDCGTFMASTRPTPEALHEALACAARATKDHRAFRVVQYIQGEDSLGAVGVIGERSATTLWFDYDSAPCGGPRCAERFSTALTALDAVAVIREGDDFHRLWLLR